MKTRHFAAFLLAFALGTAHADFAGVVVAVLDGDTVDVLVDRQPVRVRLAEIDAPEKGQAFGTRARQALATAVFRNTVTVKETGRDRFGRTLGTMTLDGRNINRVRLRKAGRGPIGSISRITLCSTWKPRRDPHAPACGPTPTR